MLKSIWKILKNSLNKVGITVLLAELDFIVTSKYKLNDGHLMVFLLNGITTF